MSAGVAPAWLTRGYAVALILHAIVVAGLLALSITALAVQGATANAAREGALLLGLLFMTGLLPAIPSAIALLSWWLCRRRGWTPSTGHMGLTVFAAAAIGALFVVTYYA